MFAEDVSKSDSECREIQLFCKVKGFTGQMQAKLVVSSIMGHGRLVAIITARLGTGKQQIHYKTSLK